MAQPIRYQPQELYGEQGEVTTHLGVDPLTGLPVLIYTFPSAPTIDAGVLESENIPGILASSYDGTVGQVVTAYSPDYGLVAPGEITLTPDFVIEAARGLRDAARGGVVHGDLHPGRFLHAEGHVLIEGYGVPWTPKDTTFEAPEGMERQSYASDVYSFAKALLTLGGGQFPASVQAALERGLALEPNARPNAQELYEAVKAALEVTRTPAEPQRVATGFQELVLPIEQEQVDLHDGGGLDHSGSSPQQPADDFDIDLSFDDAVHDAFLPPGNVDPEPLTINTDPGENVLEAPRASAPPPRQGVRPPRSEQVTADSSPGFIKDLPPGATYRSGELTSSDPPAVFTFDFDEDGPQRSINWGRVGLLSFIMVAVAAAVAALFVLRPRTNFGPSDNPTAINYLVDVAVLPANLPRVTLIVVDSPPDSRWRPGTIFGTAPNQVVLDREGRWSFVGEFQQRRSEVVTLEVPAQRSFTLVIPLPPPTAEP